MNRRLAILAPVALAAAGLAVPANAAAAAKAVCLQIVDASGDGMTLGAPHSLDSLDILSGDIATGKKNLVGALRLKSVTPDPTLRGGLTYTLSFSTGGVAHQFVYRVYGTGEREAELGIGGTGLGATVHAVDVVVDQSTGTVTWVAPRKLVPALKKPGAKFSGLGAATHVSNNLKTPGGTTKSSFGADSAQSGKSYTDMTPTCLKGT